MLAALATWLGSKILQIASVQGYGFGTIKVNNLKDKRVSVSLTLELQELLETVCDIAESLYNANQ